MSPLSVLYAASTDNLISYFERLLKVPLSIKELTLVLFNFHEMCSVPAHSHRSLCDQACTFNHHYIIYIYICISLIQRSAAVCHLLLDYQHFTKSVKGYLHFTSLQHLSDSPMPCHARCQQLISSNLRCPGQGHFHTHGIQTSNLLITRRPTLPPELQFI